MFPAARIKSPHIQKYIKNTSWLFGDVVLRQGITIFVGIYIARYLKPEGLGMLTIASTYLQLLLPIAQLGLNSLVIRDLVKNEGQANIILGTSFVMKACASLITYIIIVAICFYGESNSQSAYFILIYSLTIFFSPFQVIDFYFQSKVKSKYVVYAQQVSTLITSSLRVFGIITQQSIDWFIYCFIVEGFITTLFLILFFRMKRDDPSLWRLDKNILNRYLKEMLPLIMTGFFVVLYMKIDQVMIFEMLGSEKLGIYSAAVKLCEPFYLIATVTVSSLFPAIVNGLSISKKEFLLRSQKLFNILTLIAVSASVAVSFMAEYIVKIVYGKDFTDAEGVLQIYFWASLFVFQGVVANQCFVADNKQKYSTIYTLIGAIVNIGLNYLLIPAYGLNGSAVATLISYMLSAYLLNVVSISTRPIFLLQGKAFIAIFRPWKIIR